MALAAASFAPEALARDPAVRLPGGSLATALAELSRQTGASIGLEGAMPVLSVRPLAGRMSAGEALRRLLRGSGLVARPVGPNAYRLMRRPSPVRAPRAARVASPVPVAAPVPVDIVVTARKRAESYATSPLSLSVVRFSARPANRALPDTGAIAAESEGLALTNLGPGRNRLFVRGVADSAFNGSSQSTVSLEIDEHRATYNAPDPDLRLVDVDRVEVLKGPQGPLYGTGAMGGIYHVVLRKPDLDTPAGMTALTGVLGAGGMTGGGGSAMANLPLVAGRLGLRLVAYGEAESGWIDSATRRNANGLTVSGGRAQLRWQPDAAWTVDLTALAQWLHVDDTQYVFAPHARSRDTTLAEPHDNDFLMGAATVRGRVAGADLVGSVSYVDHHVNSRLDASASAATYGLTAPLLYDDRQAYRLFDSEVHLSGGDDGGVGWLVGLSWLSSVHRSASALRSVDGAQRTTILDWRQRTEEWAGFAELGVPLFARWRLTAGARLFLSTIETERSLVSGLAHMSRDKLGFTPSLTLSWQAAPALLLYARYASAFRPGGLSPIDADRRSYEGDELGTVELGARLQRGTRLRLEGALFHTGWTEIQSDYLLDNGLVGTRNVGDGRIDGIDLSAAWEGPGHWSLRGGVEYQDGRLVHPDAALDPDTDRRLPVVPDVTVRLGVDRALALGGWRGQAGVTARYIGHARLSFDSDLDRRMGGYALVDLAASLSRGGWTVGATLSNLLDGSADSFAFGNPFSIRTQRQYTPVQPRLFRLVLARRW